MNTCLTNVAFSISGEPVFLDQEAFLQLSFADPADAGKVVRCEWYIDQLLLDAYTGRTLSGKLTCGKHTVGARILTGEGWSGIKYQQINVCAKPLSAVIQGPQSVEEGGEYEYRVFGNFEGGIIKDLTQFYKFIGQGVNFTGSTMKVSSNSTTDDNRRLTIFASRKGEPAITKFIDVKDTSFMALTKLTLFGPVDVEEGRSYDYKAVGYYNDGTSKDLTQSVSFLLDDPTRGTFVKNQLQLSNNNIFGDDLNTSIRAFYNGQETRLNIKVINTSLPPLIKLKIMQDDSLEINSVDEGQSYSLKLLAVYADNHEEDKTSQAQFSFNLTARGMLDGNVLMIFNNDEWDDGIEGIITASYSGMTVMKEIMINDKTPKFTFTSNWKFEEKGALVNNPGGGIRSYTASNIPTGALWSIRPSGLGLRISYEDSRNCGGTNDNVQEGAATATINVTRPARIKVTWTGMAEIQDSNFETAELKVNDTLIGKATSPGGNKGCGSGPVITTFKYPEPNGLSIPAGQHILTIKCSTVDNQYHTSAYYEFLIELMPDDSNTD